ncbi:MAG TPA: hypothetical protein VGJ07_00950 [Rugosimonospora sp.]
MLPTGLDSNGLDVVTAAKNAGVNLDVVNVMAMGYYQNGDYGAFALQAAQSTVNQLKSLYRCPLHVHQHQSVAVRVQQDLLQLHRLI